MIGLGRAVVETRVSLAFRTSADVLAWIDELPREATGVLSFEGGSAAVPLGAVFVERGRVCWAAAAGLARRLVDLLRAKSALRVDAGVVESVYRRARADGTPLGEALVASGLVSPEALRDALRRHTSESLVAIAATGARATWTAREGGYSARFAFRTGDLLVAAHSLETPELAIRAEVLLSHWVGDDDFALVVARAPSAAVPRVVGLRGDVDACASEVLGVARWATSFVDIADALDGATRAAIGRDPGGRTVAVWRENELVVVAVLDPDGLARLLRRGVGSRRPV